jgi:alpha-L-rhamnosidase
MSTEAEPVTPIAPMIEHHREPLGIGEIRPRISWKTLAPAGWRQSSYELEIARAGGTRTSGRVISGESVLVPWPAEPLGAREAATVRVRVWGSKDGLDEDLLTRWSEPTSLETGLLEPADWSAVPITGDWPEDPESDERRPPLVRRSFTAEKPAAARLYVTAHGLYEVELNGTRVGREAMAPGWTG